MEFYINGEWTGNQLEKVDVINPANGEVVDQVPKGGEREATAAVDAAHAAFPEWSQRTAYERGALLEKWYALIEENQEELARTMTEEQGKPLKEASGEIGYANSFIKWYAEEGKRVYGETIPASASDKRLFVVKQPVGVVAAITPWNFPAAMITRKLAPALAVGCTTVLKPSGQTPLTALKLVELAEKAGIPKGVINVITGSSSEISEAWQKDSRVRKLTFTGSTEIGKQLMNGASETMKKLSLELGGHAPLIVTSDADLDNAVEQAVASKFRNGGQTCVCANRILVAEEIEEVFLEKFADAVSKLVVGEGLDEKTDIGPLIDDDAVDKVLEHIKDAKDKGARVVYGGNRKDGQFVEPTIISGVTDNMVCMVEETFGPLAPVSTFKTEEEAIERANATPYGLAAYLFTQNLSRAIKLAEKLEYGIVGINDGGPSAAQSPFGGWKESGLGREGGHQGIEEYLETKYISVKLI
ncbi:NAD-dependent succinate-semialdehyde dehydrogenase [Alkalicoccobacillus murimartini]|uniref:Aldehyde dehydrogenase n=1 Tax=Alkalicoccobacillus murimartini TaxID=171685 RepID=A0ABT9YC91_9BACI|nr:NAD-dependent succinate-semialdehyde dehydrogenase [Alkalicoccobacillus murimartini]MDQ0205243.1 succinate-semialdehyde dehydrogenase/glutarate-semialdehyde dehydrogenase [Alkalicoccobacillus murimartini]